jgi:hypothetical protein
MINTIFFINFVRKLVTCLINICLLTIGNSQTNGSSLYIRVSWHNSYGGNHSWRFIQCSTTVTTTNMKFTNFKYLQIVRKLYCYSLSFLLFLHRKSTILPAVWEITPLKTMYNFRSHMWFCMLWKKFGEVYTCSFVLHNYCLWW